MQTKIVLATNNLNKLHEIQNFLRPYAITLLSQQEFAISDIEETGLTFVENAILKARNACEYSGLPAIADDSGLEVDALNGAPGIYSSRFAGKNASNADNINKLLRELTEVPEDARTARFQCLMVYLRHTKDPTPIICQGTWEGKILFAPQGKNGFGYDPVFFVPTHNCSAAELDLTIKNTLSHRAQALQLLVEKISLLHN